MRSSFPVDTLAAGVWCFLPAGLDPSEAGNWTHFQPELSLQIERKLAIEKRGRFEFSDAEGDTFAIVQEPDVRPPVYFMHSRSEESTGVALSALESRRKVRRNCEFQGEICKLLVGSGFVSRSEHHVAVSDPKRAGVYFSFTECRGFDPKLLRKGAKISYRIGPSKTAHGKLVAKWIKPIADLREAVAGSVFSKPVSESTPSARVFKGKWVPKYGNIRYIGQLDSVFRKGTGAVTHGFVKRRYLEAKKLRWHTLFFHVSSLEKHSPMAALSKDVYVSFQIRRNPVKDCLVASNVQIIGQWADLYSRVTTLIGVVRSGPLPMAATSAAHSGVQPHKGWLFHEPKNMMYPFYISPESDALHSLAMDAVVRFRTAKRDDRSADGVVATEVKATCQMSHDEILGGGWLLPPNRCCDLDKLSEGRGCVVFGSEFAGFESSTVELKAFLPYSRQTGCVDVEQIIDACDKYLNAFAHSPKGGSLYFGVRDNGRIVGQKALDRDKIDLIRTEIDALIKTWTPLIGGAAATRQFLARHSTEVFVPVYKRDSSSGFYNQLPDTFLLKCSVTPMFLRKEQVYFRNREGLVRVKLHGGLDKLSFDDISEICAFSESKMDDESIADAISSTSGSHPLSDEPLAIDPSTIDSLMRLEGGELTRSQVAEVLRLCNGDVEEARSVLGPLREAETKDGSEDEDSEERRRECDSDDSDMDLESDDVVAAALFS